MNNNIPTQRSGARYKAVQALYQWQLSGAPLAEIEAQFFDEEEEAEMRNLHKGYFRQLLREIPPQTATLDAQLAPFLDRKPEQVDPVEHALLWIGAYELNAAQAPWKVVINEAVELAKVFGSDTSHKFINGVLDKLAQQLQRERQSNG